MSDCVRVRTAEEESDGMGSDGVVDCESAAPVQVLRLQNSQADDRDGSGGSILKDVMLFVPKVTHEIRRPNPPLPEIHMKDGCLNAPVMKLLCATIEAAMFAKAYSPASLKDLQFCTVSVNPQNSGLF